MVVKLSPLFSSNRNKENIPNMPWLHYRTWQCYINICHHIPIYLYLCIQTYIGIWWHRYEVFLHLDKHILTWQKNIFPNSRKGEKQNAWSHIETAVRGRKTITFVNCIILICKLIIKTLNLISTNATLPNLFIYVRLDGR